MHFQRKFLADHADEAGECHGAEIVHGDDDAGLERLQHVEHSGLRHGVAAVDRHQHDIETADQAKVLGTKGVVKVSEMADAEVGDLEDEDRIAAGHAARHAAPDVGGDIADADIADRHVVLDGAALGIPAAQDMLDRRVGKSGEVRGMRPVHGDGIGNDAAGIARIVGDDADALGAFDDEAGMADIGEADLIGLKGGRVVGGGDRALRVLRHRQAAAVGGPGRQMQYR